jgi:hypothetical protein
LKEDSSANPDGSEVPSSTFGPDESQGHCLSPLAFFLVYDHTHACLKLWLILPEAGQEALDLLPAMRGSTFFPRRCAPSSRVKKGSPLLILLCVPGRAAAGQIAPGS